MQKKTSMLQRLKSRFTNPAYFVGICGLPIVIIYGILLGSPNALHWGDADFFFAMGEGFRKTVVEYHQFPWLSPWLAGGVPVYADPQFGLFSIQSILILIFGSVAGWKIALIAYLIFGYIGFYKLFTHVFKAAQNTAILLALTWSFAWIWTIRDLGHFTFFGLAFLPWGLYYLWTRKTQKHAALKLGLICAAAINAAPHYTTIMLLSVVGLAILYDAATSKRNELRSLARFIGITALVTLPLSLHKLYFTYKYTSDNPVMRTAQPENFPGYGNIYRAVFGYKYDTGLLPTGIGKGEALVGVGPGVLLVLFLIIGLITYLLISKKTRHLSVLYSKKYFQGPHLFVTALGLLALLLAFGDFNSVSPYTMLRELPVFENTRVAVRWLIVATIASLMLIASFKAKPKQRVVINIILLINVLFLGTSTLLNAPREYDLPNIGAKAHTTGKVPKQISHWNAPRADTPPEVDDNLYQAARNNVGEITTNLTPFFDTKYGGTARCSETTPTCTFVISGNARLVSWSPNHIKLIRTKPGPIELNMNPSRYWALDNQRYLYAGTKITDPHSKFVFNTQNTTKNIDLRYSPPLTLGWFGIKL